MSFPANPPEDALIEYIRTQRPTIAQIHEKFGTNRRTLQGRIVRLIAENKVQRIPVLSDMRSIRYKAISRDDPVQPWPFGTGEHAMKVNAEM